MLRRVNEEKQCEKSIAKPVMAPHFVVEMCSVLSGVCVPMQSGEMRFEE